MKKIKIGASKLAAKFAVSPRQIQLLAERGEIPFYRLGPRALRFDEEEVLAAVRRPNRTSRVQPGREGQRV